MSSNVLQVAFHPSPERRRHTVDHGANNAPTPQTATSKRGSVSSVSSRKSEPGWLTAMNGVDRSRADSTASQSSATSSKSSSGLAKLFGKGKSDEKKKKEKKDLDQIVLTSRHAAAVKTKLALDPQLKKVIQKEPPQPAAPQRSAHITAQEQEIRRPHSGPPSLRPTVATSEKAEMPMLTRIVSGDEADEPDDWERLRADWRTRKIPGDGMMQVPEGEALDGTGYTSAPSSGTTTPDDRDKVRPEDSDIEIPPTTVVEREGVRLVTAARIASDSSEDLKPRPERHHTPIGGRWKKDEKGVWKR